MAIATDTAHQLAVCSNMGVCATTTGTCTCMQGFVGAACERLDCPSSCSGNGQCLTLSNLATYTRDTKSNSYSYTSVWDANKIKGCYCDVQYSGYDCSLKNCPNGDDPLTTGQANEVQLVKCVANAGSFVLFYKGYPSRTIQYTYNAQQVTQALLGIPLLTSVQVTFSQPFGTVCQTDTNVVSIQFLQQFGNLPPLVPLMDAVMSVNGRVSVSADGVTAFTDVSGNSFTSVIGTKEADACANRGLCSTADGVCECYATNGDSYGSSNGYGSPGTRGDCGYITSGATVSTCPGAVQCSGHGVCNAKTFRCSCSVGWTSGDCSLRTCPTGLSWFSYPQTNQQAHFDYTLCSSQGNCDTSTGLCVCNTNFYGTACQYMACGGGIASPCNGHGRCLDMHDLSLNSQINGELISSIQPTYAGYGSDPNNPNTWDAHRVQGCLCDKGYMGYDCSLMSCPMGADPANYLEHNEVQLLKCTASGGSFTLTFRNQVTPPIPYSVTSGQLAAILSALPSIRQATVTFTHDGPPPKGTLNTTEIPPLQFAYYQPGTFNGTTLPTPQPQTWNLPNGIMLCNTSALTPNIAIISFDVVPGSLPTLHVDNSLLTDIVNKNGLPGTGVVNVYIKGQSVSSFTNQGLITSVDGTTRVLECNGRGKCNYLTGRVVYSPRDMLMFIYLLIGVCACFNDWYSSDGFGHAGSLGDCGFRKDNTGVLDSALE